MKKLLILKLVFMKNADATQADCPNDDKIILLVDCAVIICPSI